MDSISANMEVMTYGDAYQIIEEFPQSLLLRYERCLKGTIRGSDFVFDFVNLLYYNYYNFFSKRCGSYIDSTDWLKKKKATINPINPIYGDNCG